MAVREVSVAGVDIAQAKVVKLQPVGSTSKMRPAPQGGPFTPDHCQGVTKKGAACTARPLKGGMLCVGHQRKADA